MSVQMMIDRPRVGVALALTMLACSPGDSGVAFAKSAPAKKIEALSAASVSSPGVMLRFVLAPSEQAARYRVRERLVGYDLPNDAVGETKSVTGAIAFDSSGNVIRQESKFVVDAATFVSDKNRRDGYVRGRLLDAEQYPTIVLIPTKVRGGGLPLPNSGSRANEVTGDLTVRGVTRPTTWKGTAQFKDGRIAGSAI